MDAPTPHLRDTMMEIGAAARAAQPSIATAAPERKRIALTAAAEALGDRQAAILDANAQDVADGQSRGLSMAALDRLRLDPGRLGGIADALRAIAAQPDPVGAVIGAWERPNGLRIRRVRSPIGVIGVIFESRPNVTADAGALCLKAGNAAILRGGSESSRSSAAIHAALLDGLRTAGLPEATIQLVPVTNRAAVGIMLAEMAAFIDVIVPRGGKSLVGRVKAEARVPVFAHLEGICHIYLHRDADPAKARRVVVNAKTRRPGVCGAAECLLIDRAAAPIARSVIADLVAAGVTVLGCPETRALDPRVQPAGETDFGREFLDMIIAARVVDGLDAAMDHIRRYGSSHTECILTENDATATRFFAELDSAILMRNASTQFADGGEFGMGAEIGIATGRLHARGPVGAEQLTTFRYLVEGNGATRA